MKVLVTGASGFVGRSIVARLCADKRHEVYGTVRQIPQKQTLGVRYIEIAEIDSNTVWISALTEIDVVIHTAARVHIMKDSVDDPLSQYRSVNVDGSLNLAQQAIEAGVKRFIFLSSIKVNGERTSPGKPFTAADPLNSLDPYGVSKIEAEQGLQSLASDANMELVIIRPPLVYGPGVSANFLSMMRWLWRGIPLPLALVSNKRSFVAIDNLVDLIETCILSPAAANQIFLVSDDNDLSTSELLHSMGQALGKPARLIPFPIWILRIATRLMGKPAIAQRLFDSLQVDISKTRSLLDWKPPLTVLEATQKTAAYFLEYVIKK